MLQTSQPGTESSNIPADLEIESQIKAISMMEETAEQEPDHRRPVTRSQSKNSNMLRKRNPKDEVELQEEQEFCTFGEFVGKIHRCSSIFLLVFTKEIIHNISETSETLKNLEKSLRS